MKKQGIEFMIGITLILAIIFIVVIYMLLARAFNERIAFIGVSVIPLGSILLTNLLDTYLNKTLGDWGIVGVSIGLLMASPVLGLIGVVLVVNAFRQGKYRVSLLIATIVAYLPLIIMIARE